MLTIEQPYTAQKFSAQEFLKALRSAEKNETILPTARVARKEAHPQAHTGNGKEAQRSRRWLPHARADDDGQNKIRKLSIVTVLEPHDDCLDETKEGEILPGKRFLAVRLRASAVWNFVFRSCSPLVERLS